MESNAYYIPCVKVVDKSKLQTIRKQLESMNLLNQSYKKYIQQGILFTDVTQTRTSSNHNQGSTFTDEKIDDFINTIECSGLEKTGVDYLKSLSKDKSVKFVNYNLSHATDHLISTLNPKGIIEEFVSNYFLSVDKFDLFQVVKGYIPKKYTLYDPLILFNNSNTFEHEIWDSQIFSEIDKIDFYECLLKIPQFSNKYTCIAVNSPIPLEVNVKRLPLKIQPIYGNFGKYFNSSTASSEKKLKIPLSVMENPTEDDLQDSLWCHTIQNGIHQYWPPLHVMFSRGNIHEKQRILNTFKNVRGNDIVDLYCGIGYFALCYLKMGCDHIYCWDINPWSIEGLIRGCKANGFKYRVIREDDEFDLLEDVEKNKNVKAFIFHESNKKAVERLKKAGPLKLAHINLGYIPSSKHSWPTASQLIAEHSTIPTMVHIHQNAMENRINEFSNYATHKFDRLMTKYEEKKNEEENDRNSQIESNLDEVEEGEDEKGDYNYAISDDEDETYNKEKSHKKWSVKCCKIEKIKTYAPDIWHICVDAEISKL